MIISIISIYLILSHFILFVNIKNEKSLIFILIFYFVYGKIINRKIVKNNTNRYAKSHYMRWNPIKKTKSFRSRENEQLY